jgi:hypothetical protein
MSDENRVSSARFGSESSGRPAAARRDSATASACPLGVSLFSSQTRGPSAVRKTSARAIPCQSGACASHMSF